MKILFFDIEVTAQKKIAKLGAIDQQGNTVYDGNNVEDFFNNAKDYDVLAGHNILLHDLKYLSENHNISTSFLEKPIIDTLWLSSLIYIRKPYHKLIKGYKTDPEDLEVEDSWDDFFLRHQPGGESEGADNDPVKDSQLSLNVFNNAVEEFKNINSEIQQILYELLGSTKQFSTFFKYLIQNSIFSPKGILLEKEIKKILSPIIKPNFFENELPLILKKYPLEFSYIFRLIEQNLSRDLSINPDCSILPYRISYVLPDVDKVFSIIYRYKNYDLKKELRAWGLKDFRVYENEHGPKISQEEIVESGFNKEDFIAILATGGGKSLCFQLPALARAEASGFLTLVISPLQSLMEDQVANLKNKYHKINVGALHSGLDPLTRKEINEKVAEGGIDLLYLSPEMLRSPSTQGLLAKRHIDRLVIDEAHCFSKWGHDFRIDYMFIADFIKELAKVNPSVSDLSISCFTATAKQEVIDEIKEYFKSNFNKDLKEYKSTAKRPNLNYEAYEIKKNQGDNEDIETLKFNKLIDILENEVGTKSCIIFTRYTGQRKKVGAQNLTKDINDRLQQDGYGDIKAAFFHGQLPGAEKNEMMTKFMSGEVNVIVATNAFGMGVDKPDVRFVIHYNIPSSLENYLQEAGRAGRDQESSRCIILYSENDLDENLLLNKSSEVKKDELSKLLKYIIKQFLLKGQNTILRSSRELIKYSGWIGGDFEEEYLRDKQVWDTKLKTALSFLEKPFPNENDPWFIKRKFNKTRRIATSTKYRNASLNDVFSHIDGIEGLGTDERSTLKEIYREIKVSRLLSIEDLPGKIGWPLNNFMKFDPDTKEEVYKKGITELVQVLSNEKLIDMDDEVLLYLNVLGSSLKKLQSVRNFISTTFDIITEENGELVVEGDEIKWDKKLINTQITKRIGNTTNIEEVGHLVRVLEDRGKVSISGDNMIIRCPLGEIRKDLNMWLDDGELLINILLSENVSEGQKQNANIPVMTKLQLLLMKLKNATDENVTIMDLENILKFLHEFGVIGVESGLFLYLTQFRIAEGNHLKEKTETGKRKYADLRAEHYKSLDDFYKNKRQQAHIMDEFVKYLIKGIPIDTFIDDYFNSDYSEFLQTYFKNRINEISRPISKAKYDEIYDVSDEQKQILNSKDNLLVIAGPGSGKTKSLVHKVGSLVLEEGVSKDEFLLLTFMRSAKFELKNRIVKLIGPQGYALKVHTFHGFAYELLEKDPMKEDMDDKNEDQIIKDAINYLNTHDIQLPYRVIMLDEFQDIGKIYFDFIEAISKRSAFRENRIKIIATGDDDQSIMGFIGGDIRYIQNFQEQHGAESVVLTRNYRSTQALVDYTTEFADTIRRRLKKGTKLVSGRVEDMFQEQSKIEAWNCKGNYLFGVIDALEVIKSSGNNKETTAVICAENETVLQINHILQKEGIKSEVLLGRLGFNLRDTLELKYFVTLCTDEDNPVTKDNIWDKYELVVTEYGENKNTNTLKKIINTILSTNGFVSPKIVKDFMVELRDEADLLDDEHQLFISTFHKAKGREFDNVIICFDPNKNRGWNDKFENYAERDNMKRLIYVGMTRAKNNLILMGNKENNKYFEYLYNKTSVQKEKEYLDGEADEISVITYLDDVFISFNNGNIRKEPVIGADVNVIGKTNSKGNKVFDYVYRGSVIQKSSSNFIPTKLDKWFKKGYYIAGAKVYQKVLYKPRGDEEEHLIYIFDLSLKRKSN